MKSQFIVLRKCLIEKKSPRYCPKIISNSLLAGVNPGRLGLIAFSRHEFVPVDVLRRRYCRKHTSIHYQVVVISARCVWCNHPDLSSNNCGSFTAVLRATHFFCWVRNPQTSFRYETGIHNARVLKPLFIHNPTRSFTAQRSQCSPNTYKPNKILQGTLKTKAPKVIFLHISNAKTQNKKLPYFTVAIWKENKYEQWHY